jgi:hypothetical protein
MTKHIVPIALLATVAACADGDVSIPSWDDFAADARRDFEGHVSYVVEGDVPVTLDELRAIYDQQVARTTPIDKATVRRSAPLVDDVWSPQRRRDLTYCIGNDFGADKGRAVVEMQQATRAWEEVADVRFHHLPAHDASCTGANTGVAFAVRPWTQSGSCAFSPSGGSACVPRTLVMNFRDYDEGEWRQVAPNLTSVGAFRHELGHVLGLGHEKPPNDHRAVCTDSVQTRRLTEYDQASVMHAPGCNGILHSDWTISALDAEGIVYLYGARSRSGTTGSVAAASRHQDTQQVVWIAPDGSVQTGSWSEGGTWQRLPIAPGGSAATDGGISIVSRVPDHYEVVWIGPDGSVRGAWWYQGGAWNRYVLAPAGSASTTAGVTAISRIATSLDVFWVAPSGAVTTAWWYEGAGPWQRIAITPPGVASLDGGVTAVSRIPTHFELFWPGPDRSVRGAYWYEGGAWQTYTLAASGSASTSATIGALAPTHDHMKVQWVTPGGLARGAQWTLGGSGWQPFHIWDALDVSTTGGIAAIARGPTVEEMYFVDDIGRVHGAFGPDSDWNSGPQIGADAARTTSPVAAVTRRRDHQEMFFITPAGGLDGALWSVETRRWTHYEIAP